MVSEALPCCSLVTFSALRAWMGCCGCALLHGWSSSRYPRYSRAFIRSGSLMPTLAMNWATSTARVSRSILEQLGIDGPRLPGILRRCWRSSCAFPARLLRGSLLIRFFRLEDRAVLENGRGRRPFTLLLLVQSLVPWADLGEPIHDPQLVVTNRLGGRIGLQSEPGAGLILPRVAPAQTSASEEAAASGRAEAVGT
jgi:hypothetical protein